MTSILRFIVDLFYWRSVNRLPIEPIEDNWISIESISEGSIFNKQRNTVINDIEKMRGRNILGIYQQLDIDIPDQELHISLRYSTIKVAFNNSIAAWNNIFPFEFDPHIMSMINMICPLRLSNRSLNDMLVAIHLFISKLYDDPKNKDDLIRNFVVGIFVPNLLQVWKSSIRISNRIQERMNVLPEIYRKEEEHRKAVLLKLKELGMIDARFNDGTEDEIRKRYIKNRNSETCTRSAISNPNFEQMKTRLQTLLSCRY
jgi:hypothetical protein